MKIRIIIVALFMTGLITQGHAQLYCYKCEDCPDGNALTDDLLVSCSGDTTEPTTTISTPIVPSETPTTEETTSTPTTEPSTEPSTEPPTEPPSEPTTGTTIESIESTTNPSGDTTTQPSIDPTTEPNTTDPPSIISTAPTPDASISTTEDTPGTEITYTTPDTATPTNPPGPPTTTLQSPGTPPIIRHNLSRQTVYNCFVLTKEVNGTEQVDRGCVVASSNTNDMCVSANDNKNPLQCSICSENQCNSGSGIIVSVLLMLCSFFILVSL